MTKYYDEEDFEIPAEELPNYKGKVFDEEGFEVPVGQRLQPTPSESELNQIYGGPEQESYMGLEPGADVGDVAQALFPLTWQGAEQGAGTLESIGRGVADAAMILVPGTLGPKVAMKAAPRVVEAGGLASKAFPLAAEGVIAGGMQAGADLATTGEVNPVSVGAMGASPFAFPLTAQIAKTIGGKVAVPLMEKTAESISEPAIASVAGAATQTVKEGGLPIVSDVGQIMGEKPWPEGVEVTRAAREIGIDPAAVPALEFGPNSANAQVARERAHAGDQVILQARDDAERKLQARIGGVIGGITGNEKALLPASAGELAQEAIPQAVNDKIAEQGVRYSTIAQQHPDWTLSPQDQGNILATIDNELEKFRVDADLDASVASEVKKLERYGYGLMNYSTFDQFNKAREYFRDYAFDPKLVMERPEKLQRAMQRIYFAISDGLKATVDANDPLLSKQLEESNKAISALMQDADLLKKAVGKPGKRGELTFADIMRGKNTAEAAKRVLPQEQWDALRQSWVDDLAKENSGRQVEYGGFNTRLRANEAVTDVALSPEEKRALLEASRLGDILGSAYPRTGRDQSFAPIKGFLGAKADEIGERVAGQAQKIATKRAEEATLPPFQQPYQVPVISSILRGIYPTPSGEER